MDFVDLNIRPSATLASLLTVAHVLAIIAVFVMPLPWPVSSAACSLLLLNGAMMIHYKALVQAAGSIIRLRVARDGSCQLYTRDQRVIRGQLSSGWFSSPLIVAFRVVCADRRLPRGVALLPDSSDKESLRRLRVFLRFAIDPSARNQ